MKKIATLLMAIMLVMGCLMISAFAAPAATVTEAPSEIMAGEDVTVSVTLPTGLPNCVGLGVIISYDQDVFSFKSAPSGWLFEGAKANWMANDVVNGDDVNGKVIDFVFACNESAPAGTYYFDVEFDPDATMDADYNSVDIAQGRATVVVKVPQIAVTGVTLDTGAVNLVVGESKTLVATVAPANASNKKVTYVSNNDAVATVDESGKIIAVGIGAATITVTTEDGGFTAECVVTTACGHTELTTVPAQESDCKTQGWDEYKKCSCGQLFAADGTTKIDEVPFRVLSDNHTGGEATCTDKAVCTVCGNPYGEFAPHDYSADDKKEETLVTKGTCKDEAVYYYSCAACGKVEENAEHTFKGEKDALNHVGGTDLVGKADADHVTQTPGYTGDTTCLGCGEITERGTAVQPTPHEPGRYVEADENNTAHIQLCSICEMPIGKAADHSSTGDNVATCVSEAVCDVCGLTYGKVSSEHVPGEYRAHLDENVHSLRCAICENPMAPAEEHSSTGDNVVTCQKAAVCDVCGSAYGEKADHNYGKEYDVKTKEGHAKTCTYGCGTTSALESHIDDATAESCEACGFVYHTCGGKEVTLVPGIVATCDKDGREAYYVCSCGKNYADEDAKTEISDLDSLVIKAKHTIVISGGIEATCTEEGLTEGRACSVCGEVFAKQTVIPATGHDWTAWTTVKIVDDVRYQERYCACGAKEENVITPEHKHTLVKVDAVAPTCETEGNIEYWYCSACDWIEVAGGVASNRLAVILPAAHTLEHVEAVAPTCETEGNIEYWYCTACDWMETVGGVATNRLAVILPAAHTLEHVEAKAATCQSEGNIEYWYCTACDWMETVGGVATNRLAVILVADHNLVHVDAKAATCLELGNIEYWYCTNCDWVEVAGGVASNLLAVNLPTLDHTIEHVAAKAAACDADGNVEYWYCTVCGYAWLDEARTLVTNLQSVKLGAAHTLVKVDAKAATCFEMGNIEYWYCTNCDWVEVAGGVASNLLAVQLPIVHNVEHVAAVAPTATENGNIEYWYCKDCGYAWLDEFCTKNTNLKAVILPATGETTEPGQNPDTGDNAIFFAVALIAVATVGTAVISFKKREN